MSGTSLDGVDAALLRTDGETVDALGASVSVPYAAQERALLRRALADAAGMMHRDQRPGCLAEAEALVTDAHAAASRALLRTAGLAARDLGVVGFHGQTVLHRPEARLTVQLGDGAALARDLGAQVAWDFRAADVAAGGQGAPLVPAYHVALARGRADLPTPLALLNLGGVANLTYLDGDAAPIACDTGPGNALLDDLMLARTGRAMDEDGATAARGRPDEGILTGLLSSPFFGEPPPKSLDRNAFGGNAVAELALEDAAATLAAFTARAVAAAVPHLPRPPALWVACGGGARNPTLLRLIGEAVGAPVVTADELGWSSDAMEAQAFGFLAVRSLTGRPLSYPGTTGVPAPTSGGRLSLP